MTDFFPESLGQKHGCALYSRAHYTQQNTVFVQTHICLIKKNMHMNYVQRLHP